MKNWKKCLLFIALGVALFQLCEVEKRRVPTKEEMAMNHAELQWMNWQEEPDLLERRQIR